MSENKIFVCGDTHGGQSDGLQKLSSHSFKEGKILTLDDYVIIAGDYGLIFNVNESSSDEKYFVKWLSNKNFTTLFVDGNHENFDRIEKLPTMDKFYGKVGIHVKDKIFHLRRGEIYTINDKKIFIFGGGRSIDKDRRIPKISWWHQEEPSAKEFEHGLNNLEKHNWKVDYIITHDCPSSIYDTFNYNENNTSLQKYLEIIKNKTEFKNWYFGHYHIDKKIDNRFFALYNNVMEIK